MLDCGYEDLCSFSCKSISELRRCLLGCAFQNVWKQLVKDVGCLYNYDLSLNTDLPCNPTP